MMHSIIRSPRWNRMDRELFSPFGNGWNNLDPISFISQHSTMSGSTFAVDITETDSDYKIVADLPGVDKDRLEVSIKDDQLSIAVNADEKSDEVVEGQKVIRRERSQGKVTRTFRLSKELDSEKIQASYKDGVLNISIPKKESQVAKVIDVTVH